MRHSWNQFFQCELDQLKQQQTSRMRGASAVSSSEEFGRVLDFGSNDYLGLRRHPELREAIRSSTEHDGWGSGASPVLSGYTSAHRQLENQLADLSGNEDCLVFSSGFACNLGVMSCLLDTQTLVLSDQWNHASLIDGIRLGKATRHVYQHVDMQDLREKLERYRGDFQRCLIVTESIFSMDGDEAPLHELAALSQQYDCGLVVDEAHAMGVFGDRGGGLLEEQQLCQAVLIKLGTLSKGLGGIGGYAAGSRTVVEFLVNRCRSYLFSTAPPAAAMRASQKAIELSCNMSAERTHLRELGTFARQKLAELGWHIPGGRSPILPVIVGQADRALELSAKLRRSGIIVPAIRPPTVPKDTCRLRISLSALHTHADIERLCAVLRDGFDA